MRLISERNSGLLESLLLESNGRMAQSEALRFGNLPLLPADIPLACRSTVAITSLTSRSLSPPAPIGAPRCSSSLWHGLLTVPPLRPTVSTPLHSLPRMAFDFKIIGYVLRRPTDCVAAVCWNTFDAKDSDPPGPALAASSKTRSVPITRSFQSQITEPQSFALRYPAIPPEINNRQTAQLRLDHQIQILSG